MMTLTQMDAAIVRETDKSPSNSDLNYPILLPGVRCVNPGREYVGKVMSLTDRKLSVSLCCSDP